MDKPKWNRVENDFVMTFREGKAVITEEATGRAKLYKPRIEDNVGSIITRFEPGFDDFETADDFIRANLIELDKIGLDEAAHSENTGIYA